MGVMDAGLETLLGVQKPDRYYIECFACNFKLIKRFQFPYQAIQGWNDLPRKRRNGPRPGDKRT